MSDPTAATGIPSPVPRSRHQRKLSNYLLDKNLQLRYILLVAHKLEDQLFRGTGTEKRIRISGRLCHIKRRDINVNLQHRRLPESQPVERERAPVELKRIGKTNPFAFLCVGRLNAQDRDHAYQDQQDIPFHHGSVTVNIFRFPK